MDGIVASGDAIAAPGKMGLTSGGVARTLRSHSRSRFWGWGCNRIGFSPFRVWADSMRPIESQPDMARGNVRLEDYQYEVSPLLG
jgi:hypothetical protein